MAKETAAQRIQRIKLEKNGLDVIKDIHRYAISGEDVDSEDIDRFKWYGLYTQNKNLQASDDETLYFMLRVKLLQGSMNLKQMRVAAGISREFARDTANFTTRQSVQFHFIQVRDLPEIFYRLKSVGLTSIFAAGDVPRNVVTCPVSGVDKNELYDVREITKEVNDYFDGNIDLVNLPRKYKVGISGCAKHCMGHEIQDLSFTAVEFENDRILFDVSVGGGLASNNQFAHHIGYVDASKILEVVKSVSVLYQAQGLRENRRKARLGHLITAWGIEKFKAEVEKSLGFEFEAEKTQEYTPYAKREHFGVHESKVDNKSYVGCAINGGGIGAKGLEDLADILQKHGATTIKTTTTQNFVAIDVPSDATASFVEDLSAISIDANPSPFKARTLSCTGMKFCKFAISETKDTAVALAEHLHETFPDFNETVSISVNGCPNSCAHPSIVDIGLIGSKFKNEDGETIAGFELILGGTLEGDKSRYGQKTKLKVEPKDINNTVEKIISSYIKSSQNNVGLYVRDLIKDGEFDINNLK
ncbi:nitrite/sulfite reductase [Sulfurimonas sp.]|uniref:nitrite/sulfite reductase n=1 Tax=Sulfurimonas sp. TaxID=2022749 RepID=UPI0025D0391E|nr:nitrite/sulfite reductase [Sulfurimonas sp.]